MMSIESCWAGTPSSFTLLACPLIIFQPLTVPLVSIPPTSRSCLLLRGLNTIPSAPSVSLSHLFSSFLIIFKYLLISLTLSASQPRPSFQLIHWPSVVLRFLLVSQLQQFSHLLFWPKPAFLLLLIPKLHLILQFLLFSLVLMLAKVLLGAAPARNQASSSVDLAGNLLPH